MATTAGLFVEERGPADGEPLLLSAGLGGSAGYWQPNLPALAERYRVILYDHRGTGRSDRALPDHVTVEHLADDMLALLDGLGVERAHIMGHAAGGIAGLALALRVPERIGGLVVVNGWSRLDPHFARCFAARLALLRHAGVEAYLRAQPIFLFPARWISEHDAELEADTASHLAHFPGGETMEKRIAALQAFDIDDRLAAITTPTLVFAAEDDMLVPSICSERLTAGLPNSELALTPWGGHACNVTDPEGFDRIVLDFLARHSIER
jgi:aminoacrylate hydrolase